MIKLDEKNFDNMISENKYTVIDFNAVWCGPCKMMKPEIEAVEDVYSDVKFCSVDIDKNTELARRFKVQLIPTVVFVKDGEVCETSVGFKKKDEIIEIINSIR